MPIAHAAIGGSAIARILRCPGSVRLVAVLPRTSSAAADKGTMLHYMLQKVIEKGLEPASLVGQSYAGVRLDAGDAKALLVPARYMVYRLIGDCVPRLEQKVRFAPRVWGTADLVAHRARLGYLIDFKFGGHPVKAEESEQLKFYAAAAWEQKRFGEQPLAVVGAIVQPAVSLQPSTVRYSGQELAEFAQRVRAIAKVALAPDAPVIPGEVQCQWCPVKAAGCPALTRAGAPLAEALINLSLRI
jgi:hypothetical protein